MVRGCLGDSGEPELTTIGGAARGTVLHEEALSHNERRNMPGSDGEGQSVSLARESGERSGMRERGWIVGSMFTSLGVGPAPVIVCPAVTAGPRFQRRSGRRNSLAGQWYSYRVPTVRYQAYWRESPVRSKVSSTRPTCPLSKRTSQSTEPQSGVCRARRRG